VRYNLEVSTTSSPLVNAQPRRAYLFSLDPETIGIQYGGTALVLLRAGS
jgi:hypothetical protein